MSYLTIAEAAARFSLTESRVRQLAPRVGHKHNNRWRIDPDRLARVLQHGLPALAPTDAEMADMLEAGAALLRSNDEHWPRHAALILAELAAKVEAGRAC